jgi:hypothetical protein
MAANWRDGHRVYWHGAFPRPPYHHSPVLGTVMQTVKPGDFRVLVQWDKGSEPGWIARDFLASTKVKCPCSYCVSIGEK